jgi:hypothetical protein
MKVCHLYVLKVWLRVDDDLTKSSRANDEVNDEAIVVSATTSKARA